MRRDDTQGQGLSVPLADAAATEALGHGVGVRLRAGDLVGLVGDLGAGKTTFVRGVHAALGATGRVRSPSFATMIEYAGDPPLHHFDLFRYEHAGPGFLEEFEEWLFGDGVAVIEWFDRLGDRLRCPHLLVRLEITGEARTAHLAGRGERWREVVGSIAEAFRG